MDQLCLIKKRGKYGPFPKGPSPKGPFPKGEDVLIEKVVNQSSYVSESFFNLSLKQSWEYFLSNNTNLEDYVFLFDTDQKINFWPITCLGSNIELITTEDICDKHNLVLVLDYMINSEVAFDTIRKFIYKRFGKKVAKIKYNIYIITPFINGEAGIKLLRQIRHNLYLNVQVSSIKYYSRCKLEHSKFTDEENDVLIKNYKAKDQNMIPVYFDFEIPDEYDTYNYIYNQLLN